jgi:hypothetical protein
MKIVLIRALSLAGLIALSTPAHAAVNLFSWFFF